MKGKSDGYGSGEDEEPRALFSGSEFSGWATKRKKKARGEKTDPDHVPSM